MDNSKSLADFLGVVDFPKKPDAQPAKPAQPPAKMTVKSFCKGILASREYRESLLRRIMLDELPAQIECLIYHYAEGKPVERLEVREAQESLDDLSVEQLEERLSNLHARVQLLRRAETGEPDEGESGKIH